MPDDDRIDAELLRHRMRQAVAWGEKNGRVYEAVYLDVADGKPEGVSAYRFGACFLDEALPDHSGEN